MFGFNLESIIASVPALLIGFAFHEYAHGWMADRLGDPTPRSQGRLTLNPLAHLDLFGTIMAVLYHFGWAKPVQTNPRYYKMDPLKGHMLVALAGPVMNLIIAFVAMLIWGLFGPLLASTGWYDVAFSLMGMIVTMNLGLAIFNLLPVPPLDGFSVLSGVLPSSVAYKFRRIEPYGFIILILLLLTDVAGMVIYPVMTGIATVFQAIVNPIISLIY